MDWHYLISLQVTLVAFSVIITRLLARDKKTAHGALAITAGWFLVLYLVGLLILPHVKGVNFNSFHQYPWRFVLGGLSFALSNLFGFLMLTYLDVAVATILGTISAVFTVFGASIFLDEKLNDLQIFGTCLLLLSVVYGLLATRHRKNRQTHRNLAIGGAYTLISAVFYAISAINEKYLLGHVSVGSYILYGWGFQVLAAVALAITIQPKGLRILLRPNVFGWTVTLGVIRAVSGLCFVYSLIKSNNVGLVTVVSNFKLIIIILLGAWLLHERTRIPQKLLAATGATIALGMLFWR